MSKTQTILVVKNRALGDSIMGLSALQYLKELYPESNIIYAVPQWIAPLYEKVKTDADSIYPLKIKKMTDVFKLFLDIKKRRVTHIHEMHQSGRGKKIFTLIAALLRVPYTAHNHHLKTKTKVIDQGKILPLIQRDLDGVYSFLGKGKSDRPAYLNYPPRMQLRVAEAKSDTIIFGVVATRQTKMWPLEDYVRLAQLIAEVKPQYSILIPLSKGSDDQKIKNELLNLNLPKNATIVEWPLSDLALKFQAAKLYVGNDTGLKHLAVAVGLKSYTFFGPEPANEWHPYDSSAHPYFYLEGLACRTRTHHYCGLAVCDLSKEYMQCLKFIRPEEVLEAIKKDL